MVMNQIIGVTWRSSRTSSRALIGPSHSKRARGRAQRLGAISSQRKGFLDHFHVLLDASSGRVDHQPVAIPRLIFACTYLRPGRRDESEDVGDAGLDAAAVLPDIGTRDLD